MTFPYPVVWSPSDLSGPDSDGHVGRGTQPIRALVYHRIVGTLETTVNSTFAPSSDPALTPGERRVSSHFGLGHWGTALRIVQFVALENTAYCNGQHATDKAACTWQLWINAGRPDPNEMTVSFEHEDNAAAGNYIVTPDIVEMSIALSKLLLSGNGPAIRAAGIRCSDTAAAQLGRIRPSAQTLVPHKTVAPISKPWCWMPYGGDKGFPQARYISELTAPEDSVGLSLHLAATTDATPLDAFGTARVKGPGHAMIRVSDRAYKPVADGLDLGVVQKGALVTPLDAVAGDRRSVVAFNSFGETYVALLMDVTFTPLPVPPALVDTTPFSQADLDAKAVLIRGTSYETARAAAIKGAGDAIDALPR